MQEMEEPAFASDASETDCGTLGTMLTCPTWQASKEAAYDIQLALDEAVAVADELRVRASHPETCAWVQAMKALPVVEGETTRQFEYRLANHGVACSCGFDMTIERYEKMPRSANDMPIRTEKKQS